MPSIFSKIVSGEILCHKVAEDDRCLAFLDIQPVVYGHTLVIPKQEIDYYFDLDNALLAHLHVFAKQVAIILKEEIECKRIGVMIAGLEVPHAHIHLIPMQSIHDLSFSNERVVMSDDAMTSLSTALSTAYRQKFEK